MSQPGFAGVGGRQRGASLTSFMLCLLAGLFTLYVVARLLPAYLDNMSYARALQQAARGQSGGHSLSAARQRYLALLSNAQGTSAPPDDLQWQAGGPAGGQLWLRYARPIHLFYNIDVMLHFENSAPYAGAPGEAK